MEEWLVKRWDLPCASICKLAVNRIQDRSEKNPVREPNVDKHGRIVPIDAGVDHVRDANG